MFTRFGMQRLLHQTISTGTLEDIQALLRSEINLRQTDENGRTLLHTAAAMGKVDIVIYLYQRGVNLNSLDNSLNSAFHLAFRYGRFATARALTILGMHEPVKHQFVFIHHLFDWKTNEYLYLTMQLCLSYQEELNIDGMSKEYLRTLHQTSPAAMEEKAKILLLAGFCDLYYLMGWPKPLMKYAELREIQDKVYFQLSLTERLLRMIC